MKYLKVERTIDGEYAIYEESKTEREFLPNMIVWDRVICSSEKSRLTYVIHLAEDVVPIHNGDYNVDYIDEEEFEQEKFLCEV